MDFINCTAKRNNINELGENLNYRRVGEEVLIDIGQDESIYKAYHAENRVYMYEGMT